MCSNDFALTATVHKQAKHCSHDHHIQQKSAVTCYTCNQMTSLCPASEPAANLHACTHAAAGIYVDCIDRSNSKERHTSVMPHRTQYVHEIHYVHFTQCMLLPKISATTDSTVMWEGHTHYRCADAVSFVKANNALDVQAIVGSLRSRPQLQIGPDLSVFAVGINHHSLQSRTLHSEHSVAACTQTKLAPIIRAVQ